MAIFAPSQIIITYIKYLNLRNYSLVLNIIFLQKYSLPSFLKKR